MIYNYRNVFMYELHALRHHLMDNSALDVYKPSRYISFDVFSFTETVQLAVWQLPTFKDTLKKKNIINFSKSNNISKIPQL